jgi:hypothetical protein
MKKYSHSRHYGNRFNWRALVISGTLLACFVMSNYGNQEKEYVADKPELTLLVPVIVEPEPTVEDKIRFYFPKSWKTMIAIAHAESGMDHDAIGYNCFYNYKETILYIERVKGSHSTSCKKEHRKYAWSVDCGILQRNYKGKSCPDVSVDEHLEEVAELSKVQGFKAWAAYNNNSYKKYLAKN